MNEIILVLSWILQLIGFLIVLWSNLRFFYKARRGKFHSVKKEFVAETAVRFAMTDEELLKANADEALRKFPIANLSYTNYRDSVIGVLFTLTGVIIGAATLFI